MNYYFNIKKKWIAEVIVTFIGVSILLNVNNDIELTSDVNYAYVSTLGMTLSYENDYVASVDFDSANTSNFSLSCDIDIEPNAQIDPFLYTAIPFGLETISYKKQKDIVCKAEVSRYRFIEPSEPIYVFKITNSNISAELLNVLDIPANTTFYILAGNISCDANVSTTQDINDLGLVVYRYVFGVQLETSTPFNFNIKVTTDFDATALFNFSFITPTSFVIELVYQPIPEIIANVSLTWVRRFIDLSGMVFSDLDGLTFEDLLYN